MPAPKVFVSYSHDSEDHKAWVLRLASDLRSNGIEATLDRWDLAPGQDTAAFMAAGMGGADRVVLVCSDTYVFKAERGTGGVGYERLIVTGEVVASIDTKKFIPILRGNPTRKIPNFLGPRFYIDFGDDASYKAKLEELLREILDAPAAAKPPLGSNPFSGAVPATGQPRMVGASGRTAAGRSILDSDWFEAQKTAAHLGILGMDLRGSMELRVGLHSALSRSQLELLNGVRQSEIRTFGWPIGVLLENRDEYRPKPMIDGIRAEIAVAEQGRRSYDYWAAHSTGDFFLLQSLFEDSRTADALFFNTRIVRATEALLFAERFNIALAAPLNARMSVRLTHSGLSRRTLQSSTSNRVLFHGGMATADVASAQVESALGDVRENLVELVRSLCAPLFVLFDFQEFAPAVYEDIVRRFERGEVT